ncbi:hypothetical protein GCM10009839_27210 [Catenulispora yoronensis]|uniref:NlpC/P60 domain-containing protein n=1 Tax=Catenulispora yoronensis TaxID=450799 RepID=A0ABN2U1X0_9ACTN
MSVKTRIATVVAAVGAAVALTAVSSGAADAAVTPNSSAGGTISRSEELSRAASWNGTPYSTSSYKAGPGGDISYRTDCSGYVSMALHLGGSYTTVSLPQVVTQISKDSLQPGDLLGVLGSNTGGNAGHVLIFDGWANSAHSSYNAWEDSGDAGVHHLTIPYPYWPNTSGPAASLYKPYRYNHISDSGGVTMPAWPNVVVNQSGANVQALQYLLRAHGSTVAADGQFGNDTLNAVKAFQSANGLGVDGQVGPQTWTALVVQVQSNATGEAVKAAQTELNKFGYGLGVDGQFGAATDSAARAFQSAHGLGVDGQIGPQTWQMLVGS